MPLTPIAVYYGQDIANGSIVFGPFTPTNGEYWTIASSSWDTANPTGAPSGGGQTYTARVTAAPGGFNGYARVDDATVSGSPGSMSVTVPAPTGNTRHSASLVRWPVGSSLDAVNTTVSGTGLPSSGVTTTQATDGSHQVSCDVASIDPATRAYLNSATELGVLDGHVGANSVQYHAYVTDLGAAGAKTIGLSAPGGQTWVQAVIAVKGSSGTDYTRSATDDAGLTDSASTAAGYFRTVTDSAGLTDNANTAAGYFRTVTDSAGLTDGASTAAGYAHTFTDLAGLTDGLGAVVVYQRGFTDSAGLTDSAAVVGPTLGTVSEMAVTQGRPLWSVSQGADDEQASIGSSDWEITT